MSEMDSHSKACVTRSRHGSAFQPLLLLVLGFYFLANSHLSAKGNPLSPEQAAMETLLSEFPEARSVLDVTRLEKGLFDFSSVLRTAGASSAHIFGVAASRLPESRVPEQRDIIRRAVIEHCRLVASSEAVASVLTSRLHSQFLIVDPQLARFVARHLVARRLAAFVEQDHPVQIQLIDGIVCVLVSLDKDKVSPVVELAVDDVSPGNFLPEFSASTIVQGYRLLRNGNDEDALRHFAFAEKADPNASSTFPGLLMCHLRAGRHDDLRSLALARIDRESLSSSILRQAGKICEDANEFDLALRLYTSALQKAPADDEIELCLVRLYLRLTTMDRLTSNVSQSPTWTRKEDESGTN